MIRLCTLAGIMVLAGGCNTMAKAESEPAILVEPSAETQAELRDTVSKALGGRTIRLSADALTKDNRLIIDRAQHMRDGSPIMGRKIEKPDHFYLMMTGGDCVLKHEETGEVYKLGTARCQSMT